MAEPEFGPPCPGCTPEKISAQIARFPSAMTTCRDCRDHGALAHDIKQKQQRVREDATINTGGQGGEPLGSARHEGSHGQG